MHNAECITKHKFKEHEYVKRFFENEELIEAVRRSGMKMAVGFDSHVLEDYNADRIKAACRKLEELGLPMID